MALMVFDRASHVIIALDSKNCDSIGQPFETELDSEGEEAKEVPLPDKDGKGLLKAALLIPDVGLCSYLVFMFTVFLIDEICIVRTHFSGYYHAICRYCLLDVEPMIPFG